MTDSDRDAFTTSADFIISPHSGARGLYVGTGGNFHGFKFFPVIGKYIVQKWAWDRERPDSQLNPDYPRFDMKDLLDKNRQARL
jgi:glycine/D-amino acid oxidase-like deaminating enzyme